MNRLIDKALLLLYTLGICLLMPADALFVSFFVCMLLYSRTLPAETLFPDGFRRLWSDDRIFPSGNPILSPAGI